MFDARKIMIIGHTGSWFIVISYLLCIGFGVLFPGYRMVEGWSALLPGFEWLSLKGFLFGLIGSYLYGWYIAVLWVPLYGFFAARHTPHV